MVYTFLQKIPLFMGLSPEDLARLCEMVTEQRLPAGQVLFKEGEPGDRAYVIQSGELEIIKESGGQKVILAVRQQGEVIGEMSLLESAPRFATVRARSDSDLLVIEHKHLDDLLNNSTSAAKAMLHTITSRLRSSQLLIHQSEKMAQLGTLTAGIAHELNNPAAAIGRGANQLQEALSRLQQAHLAMAQQELSVNQMEVLVGLDQEIKARARQPVEIDPLSRSDQEEALEDWLDAHGVEGGWELAPILVDLGAGPGRLDELAEVFEPAQLPDLARWMEATFSLYGLLEEIGHGAARMSEIIKALKSYVYLDQAPVQKVNLHAGLDNTLVMMRGKLKNGVNVRRQYDPALPVIMAYASELNQVWTNLIDNAIDAMDGRGELAVRTRHQGDWVFVEFEDNGAGIAPEHQEKLFTPFFTTKPVGKGTGLGLNTSYNIIHKHGGNIKFVSRPGMTRFTISLPVNFEHMPDGSTPATGYVRPGDEALRSILEATNTIAVVGITNTPGLPAATVPAYLQRAGYRIIPVNPELDEVLGEPAYPDLPAVSESVDTVLIFRRSEFVPEIVDQAIRIGAKAVWMQEGILNENAAAAAEGAGLQVVMNTCMRTTHRRLISR